MDERAAFTLRLPQGLLEQLNELAWRSRKNRNEFVVNLIEEAIKDAGLLEDNSVVVAPKRPVGRPKKADQ